MDRRNLDHPSQAGKAYPHNMEAEQALLGAIMVNNEAFKYVSDFLEPKHFHFEVHERIYEVMAQLLNAGKLATPITLKSFLPAEVLIADNMTCSQYLARLASEATTVINAPDYGRLIYDLYDMRAIVDVGQVLLATGDADPATLAGTAIDTLDSIVAKRSEGGSPALTATEASVRALDAAANAYQRDGKISGLSWGLKDLDHKTLGMQRQELIVLAGRPGMGKTALGLCIMRAASELGHRTMFGSLEMGDISLTQRVLADMMYGRPTSNGRPMSYWQMRSGRFSESDFHAMTEATQRFALMPLKIEQQSGLTLAQIAARARQMKRRDGLDLLIVDHLHLIKPSGRYAGNRVNELGETSSGLKALAKDLDIAVLALCQLSRGVEGRDDKRPNLGDLRGSGDIEQDADTVVMLYREGYYLSRTEPDVRDADKHAEWQVSMERAHNKLEAIIEKQRNGPIGMIELFADMACNAVRDRTTTTQLPEEFQQSLAI